MSKTNTSPSNDLGDETSLRSRDAERVQMEEQVQAFLSKGGEIQNVDAHVTADPPQKPTNNYCSRPI